MSAFSSTVKSQSISENKIEDVTEVKITPSDVEYSTEGTRRAKMEKTLLRKLDIRMSILVVMYILNYIDRNNMSAARLQGLEQDLGLNDNEYDTVLSILYIGYITMQIPSNMFMNWIERPSLYLPSCMVIWGVISILTGITQNYTGALLVRFFIGFAEAAFFPGSLFLIARWYKRDEVALRTAILYCGSLISNAFGSLIASGILSSMQGKLGEAAWRWLFFIEGSMTIFVSICAMVILPDFPHNTRWLSPEERQLAVTRMEEDASMIALLPGIDTDNHVSPVKGLIMALTDWKVWWFAVAAACIDCAQSFYIFFPTLSATMGFNTTVSLLLCAPPFLLVTILSFIVTRHSDRSRKRFPYIGWSVALANLGFIIAMSTMNTAARYISLFLMAESYAGLVVFYAWMSNSFPWPPEKRAVAIAFINAFMQLGNVGGSYAWPTSWGPTYRFSYAISLVTLTIHGVMCWMMSLHLASLNKWIEKEEIAKGVKVPGFRYLL